MRGCTSHSNIGTMAADEIVRSIVVNDLLAAQVRFSVQSCQVQFSEHTFQVLSSAIIAPDPQYTLWALKSHISIYRDGQIIT